MKSPHFKRKLAKVEITDGVHIADNFLAYSYAPVRAK